MFDMVPPPIRRWLPVLVLALAALSSFAVALQIFLALPELWWIAAAFLGSAALQGVGAWGLYRYRFWARGYAIGALLAGGVGVGAWYTSIGLVVPASLIAVIILVSDDAPGQFERRQAFLDRKKLDASGARRLFWVALGLGLGLPALLGSPLSVLLFTQAPVPSAIAAALAILGFFGLTRLAGWCYVALIGSVLSLAVAIVMCAMADAQVAVGWGSVCLLLLLGSSLPLARPVLRHLFASPRG